MTDVECATLAGVRFSALTLQGCIDFVEKRIGERRRTVIAFANAEFVIEARKNDELRRYLTSCDLVLADGISVVLMSRVFGCVRLPERVTGTDFVAALAELASRQDFRLCFVGGTPGVAAAAARRLSDLHPGAKIVGCIDGFEEIQDNEAAVRTINATGADAIMVCLGNPAQERWIARNASRLIAPLLFGNGGALDFWSGRRKRAPEWIQRLGLEWLFRLLQEPTAARLRRQLRLPLFPIYVAVDHLRRAYGTSSAPPNH